MKKLFSMLLVAIMITTLLTPSFADAATVKISKAKAIMEVDSTLTLKISGTTSKATWTTSKKTVATVSSTGAIIAKAEGQATITATVSNKKYNCVVTVVDSSQKEITAKKGTVTELTIGFYTVGEDFPAGKYNIKAVSGRGLLFADGNETDISASLAEEGSSSGYSSTYNNFKVYYGDEIEITGNLVLKFSKLD